MTRTPPGRNPGTVARYVIELDGLAVTKGRPRFGGRVYTPEPTRTWEERIGWAFISKYGRVALEGDIRLSIWFRQRRGDWDNLAKAVCDGLNGIAYKDDAQICEAHVYKERQGAKGGKAWTTIEVEEL